jgi:hypothetical protein
MKSKICCDEHENNGRIRPLYSNCQSVSGCTNIAGVRNQELAGVWNQEVVWIWSHEPVKLWNHGLAKLYVQIPEIRES